MRKNLHNWRFGGPGRSPVTTNEIRGNWSISQDLVWPAIVWNDGKCWAYLHDLSAVARNQIMGKLREAELDRSHHNGVLTGW